MSQREAIRIAKGALERDGHRLPESTIVKVTEGTIEPESGGSIPIFVVRFLLQAGEIYRVGIHRETGRVDAVISMVDLVPIDKP